MAGILRLVDAMAETHDLLAPGQAIPDRTLHHVHRIIGCGLPDIHQRVHDLLVRPAMQRPLEGADRRDHRRMHVGQGGGTDPGGERGGVHRVVGMQHETGVEDLCLTRGRRRTAHLQQEVGGEPELRLGGADLAPVPRGMVGGDKERLLGDEPGGLADVCPGRVGVFVRVVGASQGDQASHRLHRRLPACHVRQAGGNQRAEGASSGDLVGVGGQFHACGRVAPLQEIGDFLEGRGSRKLMDVVPAVEQ